MKKILMCLLLTTGFAFAQDPVKLDLKDAVVYALEHKAEAEKARLDIKRADSQIAEVRANALPNISASANTTYNPLLQENVLPGEIFGLPGEDIAVAFGKEWTSNANAQLTQALFNQQVFTGLKAAKSTKEFYQLNAQLTHEEIIERVATAYFQVYQTRQMLENIETNLKLTRQTVEIVKGLFDNGLAKKIDFDRTTVALNNLTASRQQLINAVALSENALKFMIGMPIGQEISLPQQSFAPAILPEAETGQAERTEIQLVNKQIELLNWQKKASIAEYYPSLALFANYGWLGQGDVVRLHALLALARRVGDLGTLSQRLEAVGVDAAVMDEQILAVVVRGDEAEALVVVEPLDGSVGHESPPCVCELRRGGALRQRLRALNTACRARMARPDGAQHSRAGPARSDLRGVPEPDLAGELELFRDDGLPGQACGPRPPAPAGGPRSRTTSHRQREPAARPGAGGAGVAIRTPSCRRAGALQRFDDVILKRSVHSHIHKSLSLRNLNCRIFSIIICICLGIVRKFINNEIEREILTSIEFLDPCVEFVIGRHV